MSSTGTNVEPTASKSVTTHRLGPSVGTFLVVAIGIYLTVHLAVGLVLHVVVPVLAVLIAAYLAVKVYHWTGPKAT